MSGINKVILVGNLAKDPEVKFSAAGNAIANLTVATSESWKDKATGEKKEKAEFHRVVIFGKLAEIAGEYLRKGSKVYLEGKLQTRKWQDQNGQDRYSTEVVLDGFSSKMEMLSPPSNQGGQKPQQQMQQPQQRAPQQQAPQQQMTQQQYNEQAQKEEWQDNIPF